MNPKVLVFTPVYEKKDYCFDKFMSNAKKLTYPNFDHIIIDNSKTKDYYTSLKRRGYKNVYHIERGNNTREALARAENFARKKAIEGGYDYLFSLESDILCPPEIIETLMSHRKKVVTGLYMIGVNGVSIPCITVPEFSDKLQALGTRLLKREEIPKYQNAGLAQVHTGGLGCALIHRDIFTKYVFRYDPRYQSHSDVYFFSDLWNDQVPIYVDTDMYCDHDNSDWALVEDK